MSRPAAWYQDAVIYELRVGAFSDSNGDGVGDFPGLTARLDYLQDLGVTAVWLLPFYPSPLRDDGYDISDYRAVRSDAGTLQDFKVFVREAHRRNLKVITELVLNHTSDQHPWFQRARRAEPGSRWRDFYVWSPAPDRYPDARIIFKDFEASNWSWDPVAKAYYWHRFYASQPDLNFDHAPVRRAMFQAVDFWLGLGVDGLRLDAVPYLFEREGTNCENLPETHAFLRSLRRHVDQKFRQRMLLAEANQWPEEAVAYFGSGDECHMAFHFPIMPRLFMALHMEERYPIVDIISQTPPIPEAAQWALFLRNHDELTLEMVTDEERDYMYRVYAHDPRARINLGIRRRLAPLLGNDRRRIELMNALLFSLPGTPILYYGDEIGMGDNMYLGDRNGVRTPMQWSPDRNAGFSRANPQRLYLPVIIDPEYHYETVNVEAQENNPHSLLWWMRRLIALRKQYRAFGRGTLEFLHPRNGKVLVFLRRLGDERVLVVANLSRFSQYVELDLSAFKGMMAVEVFGGTEFPPIGELPYLLTLGPHAFYWFSLVPARREAIAPVPATLPALEAAGHWTGLLDPDHAEPLERALPRFLQTKRWFAGKARAITGTRIAEAVRVPVDENEASLALVEVSYRTGSTETYALPLGFAPTPSRHPPEGAIAQVTVRANGAAVEGVLFDPLTEAAVPRALVDGVARGRRIRGRHGSVVASATRAGRTLLDRADPLPPPSVGGFEQSNTSIRFGERCILKLFRRVDEGVNPDLEIGRFLTEKASFPHVPPLLGAVEYRRPGREPATLAVLQGFVPNEGDGWHYTLDEVERYFERAVIRHREHPHVPLPTPDLLALADQPPSDVMRALVAGYLETARLLGRRTAELHLALASAPSDPAFAPEPFSGLYQRSLYQSLRNLVSRVFRSLEERIDGLPATAVPDARHVLEAGPRILKAFQALLRRKISALRLRCHGDYHLGQLLHTGRDFVIIDFEGEPARPLSERRIKRTPLRDVAGMLRSFHYAAYTVFATRLGGGLTRAQDLQTLEPWVHFWYRWTASAFLRAYLPSAADGGFLPHSREELALLLRAMLLEKAVYELGYELNSRPDWSWLPLKGIIQLLETFDHE